MKKLIMNSISAIERFRLKEKAFVLISNNCWGYELYTTLGRKYNTPFVGLFLFPECYIRFLEQFETCIKSKIKFINGSKYVAGISKYPIGLLCGDIEIHFMHYSSEGEALEKWNRRIDRLRQAINSHIPLFMKFCDRDGCTKEHIARFHALPFRNKLSIGINPFDAVNHLYQPKMKDPEGACVMDGLTLYQKRYHYFDISCWLSNGNVRHSSISRILALIS